MTPASQLPYAVTLFLALESLLLWNSRRHRAAIRIHRGIVSQLR